MEIKHLVSKYVYRIEPKPDGGFIARATDPNIAPLEASTREELRQKIQAAIFAGLGADFPGLKLPPQSSDMKFSFHIEKQPDGSFDIHSSDPNTSPINAASHDQVESRFAEKLISFVGKHMLDGAPEALRAQLASGDIKVFINKTSGFSVTTGNGTAGTQPRLSSSLSAEFPDFTSPAGSSGPAISNTTPDAPFGGITTSTDSSPITPGSSSSGNILRFLLALAVLAAVIFFFLRHR